MKSLNTLLLILITLYSSNIAQEVQLRKEFPSHGTKIYSINFVNSTNGWAESFFGDILITTNGGKNWEVKTGIEVDKNIAISHSSPTLSWSADIYCSVMQSNDGGESWTSYPYKKEEHFCSVYFKDGNTGWKVAEEFLKGVVNTIANCLIDNEWEKKIDVAYKCREYYTDIDTGWSVGWCFNNLVTGGM
jgi:hypothetical protein